MPLKDNEIYVFNSDYVLKNDIYRVILYTKEKTENDSSINWKTVIHPIQAMILSYFSHKRTFNENSTLISNAFSMPYEQVVKMIDPYIENENRIVTKWNGHPIHFPKNVLIKARNINHKYSNFEVNEFICDKKIDLSTNRFYSGPYMLTLMLTNNCVTKCNYCYADTHTVVKSKIQTERILTLIEEAQSLKMKQINLIGGEIFLYKDWYLVLNKLIECKLIPEYISTKHPLSKDIIDKLKRSNYHNYVQFSLDANSEELLKQSIGVSDNYLSKVKEGLYLLDKSGLKYRIATVLTKINCDFHIINSLYCFIKTLNNVSSWSISPASNSLYINNKEFSNLKSTKAEIDDLFLKIETNIIPNSKFEIILNKPICHKTYYSCELSRKTFKGSACSALNYHLFILPDGQVTICEQLYWDPRFIIGDINNSTIMEVWNSPKALFLSNLEKENIQEASECKRCEIFDTCFKNRNRCWTDVMKAYGKKNWDYPDPRCINAPSMIYNIDF